MAHSYTYLRRKAGLPEPAGLAAPEPAKRSRVMFEVRRSDVPHPMAFFASDAWAEQWVGTLSQPPSSYKIRPVEIELDSEIAALREDREWLLFLVNSLRLPLGVDASLSNFDREKILSAMQDAAMAKQP